MTRTPRFSVCMPASRPTTFFDEALRSVLAQTTSDLEAIVTDDSGGRLADPVRRFGDERVRYVSNDRPLGLSGNHCKAFGLASGSYVAVLHDDDSWRPTYLEEAGRVLDHSPEVGLVISAAHEVSVDGVELRRRPTAMRPGLQTDPLRHILDETFLMAVPSVAVWRRRALDANHRPWPDLINADITAFIDPIITGWQVYYQSQPLVRYRVHDDQIGARKQFLHRDGLVKIWGAYRFARHDHERLRRRLLARCYLARAGAHLKAGRMHAARADVGAAWRTDHRAGMLRTLGLRTLCAAPGLAGPAEQAVAVVRSLRHRPDRGS